MMNNYNPYAFYGYQQPNQSAGQAQTPQGQSSEQTQQGYKQQNSKTHFAMGIAAGAAVAYLLTNKKFKEGVVTTGEKAWSSVRGEVEELKERLEDTQAELEYYRNLHKDKE